MLRMLVSAAVLALGLVEGVNECAQYPTCQTCLNVDAGETGGSAGNLTNRPNCGWCHLNIRYKDGTTGAKCADIREKTTIGWTCPSIYDNAQCSAGYECTAADGGTCKKTTSGEGPFASEAECKQYFPDGCATPKGYKCDIRMGYKCVECDAHDTCTQTLPNCQDNCKAPPTPPPSPGPKPPPRPVDSFKCNRAKPDLPTCDQCTDPQKQEGCSPASSACIDCKAPTKMYVCNNKTFTCDAAAHGSTQQGCAQTCYNHTPPELLNTMWRGFEAQEHFVTGEWDYRFDDKSTVEIKNPTGEVNHGHVSYNGFLAIRLTDGKNAGKLLQAIQPDLNHGEETDSIALAMGDYDQPAPGDLSDAMTGERGQRVHILSKCLDNKGGLCDFSSVFAKAKAKAEAEVSNQKVETARRLEEAATPLSPNVVDPCNQYTSCATCIPAKIGNISCGWCGGGVLHYLDPSSSKTAKCGGYQGGLPKKFTCPANFKTSDCSGYKCDWTNGKCIKDDDSGEYPDLQSCEHGEGALPQCGKPTGLVKCDYATKQCVPCTGAGCLSKAVCDVKCSSTLYKCNYITRKCEVCDPSKDPSGCTQTQGGCEGPCAQSTFGLCNTTTGKCHNCDPKTRGCIEKCDDPQTGCRITPTPVAPTPPPAPAPPTFYGCDWSLQPPKCVPNKKKFDNNTECAAKCQAAALAVCDEKTFQCVKCDAGSPGCTTRQICGINCHPKPMNGTYRGNEISRKFERGEWDFTIYPNKADHDTTVAFGLRQGDAVPAYEATMAVDGGAIDGGGQRVRLELTKVPAAASAPIKAKVGDEMRGLLLTRDGEYKVTSFLYLALSLPGGAAPTTFDAGMADLEFVLVKCNDGPHHGHCDFSSAKVPE